MDQINSLFSQWLPNLFAALFIIYGKLGKYLCNALMLHTSPKQNGRKSRHGISLASNPLTRGGDVRRKCPWNCKADRHIGRASLFLPGISYRVFLMSVQVAETKSHHLPPFYKTYFNRCLSLNYVKACVVDIIGHRRG